MSGWHWVAQRVAGAAMVWLSISFLAFSLSTLAPGDPAEMILLRRTGETPPAAEVQALREHLGLNRPFLVRYVRWLSGTLRGNFGNSYRTGQPVLRELFARFPATLALALTALAVGIVIAVPLAVAAAASHGNVVDHLVRLVVLAGASMPSYWLGYMLMLALAVALRLLPVSGSGTVSHIVLPATALGLGSAASMARMLRASLLDELGEDYVRTARAKGRSPIAVLVRHALRNALNPLVTVGALRFGRLLGEAVIVETVFAWPGIGRWMIESIYDRDYPAIQGFVLYIATVFILVNLAVDAMYRLLDPRVRPGALAGS
jgi:peptide/nickel transport system permease protein